MTGNSQANVRAFIAVELPPQVHALLSTVQSEFREMMGSAAGGVRWARPEGTHLTLQFLGDVPRDSIQGIQEELRKAAAGISRFTLEVTGVGAFPSTRRPRVIWVGLDGDKQHVASLQRLQQSVAAGMQGLGFKTIRELQDRTARDFYHSKLLPA